MSIVGQPQYMRNWSHLPATEAGGGGELRFVDYFNYGTTTYSGSPMGKWVWGSSTTMGYVTTNLTTSLGSNYNPTFNTASQGSIANTNNLARAAPVRILPLLMNGGTGVHWISFLHSYNSTANGNRSYCSIDDSTLIDTTTLEASYTSFGLEIDTSIGTNVKAYIRHPNATISYESDLHPSGTTMLFIVKVDISNSTLKIWTYASGTDTVPGKTEASLGTPHVEATGCTFGTVFRSFRVGQIATTSSGNGTLTSGVRVSEQDSDLGLEAVLGFGNFINPIADTGILMRWSCESSADQNSFSYLSSLPQIGGNRMLLAGPYAANPIFTASGGLGAGVNNNAPNGFPIYENRDWHDPFLAGTSQRYYTKMFVTTGSASINKLTAWTGFDRTGNHVYKFKIRYRVNNGSWVETSEITVDSNINPDINERSFTVNLTGVTSLDLEYYAYDMLSSNSSSAVRTATMTDFTVYGEIE